MQELYTVTEIADRICRADGLRLSDHAQMHSFVKNCVRRNLLEQGQTVDARGTWAFPMLEVYRARILSTFARFAMDIANYETALARALSNSTPAHDAKDWPKRTKVEGGSNWRGLRDIVEGVAAGERWILRARLYRAGYTTAAGVKLQFVWLDSRDQEVLAEDAARNDENFGTGKPQAEFTFDLNELFAGLPKLEAEA